MIDLCIFTLLSYTLQYYIGIIDSVFTALLIRLGIGSYLFGALPNAKIVYYEIHENVDDRSCRLERSYSDYFVEFISRRCDAVSLRLLVDDLFDLRVIFL